MLTFRFTGISGEMTVSEPLTSGMVGREMQFDLSEEWEDLSKTAVFAAGCVCRSVSLTGPTVVIPGEVLRSPYKKLRVGIRGDREDGSLVIPTIMAEGPFILPGAEAGTASEMSGGTARASDIAAGETAYVGGRLVTGTLPRTERITLRDAEPAFYYLTGSGGESQVGVSMSRTLGDDLDRAIVDGYTVVCLSAPASGFGSAKASDVLAGVTFTSGEGFQVAGTMVPAAELSFENAAVGFAFLTGTNGESGSSVTLQVTLRSDAPAVLVGPGTVLTLSAPMSEFGTAAKADVAAGKTFTSAAGLCVSGTMEA